MVRLKYRIFCKSKNTYEYIWLTDADPTPTLCPSDSNHLVDQEQTAIVEIDLPEGQYS